ncbi:SNO glutamine amidotransferase family-domain-containing protein [Gymnopilus junonius]|uniref:glutaminase n=1 Tax=Gymnopilus junonius TaxID=109634 RepID=A0A9P5TPN3_GYMJU|nr:SNO glutamine amidotransferase family-domain-containing protein [Gymnopilus junonius]
MLILTLITPDLYFSPAGSKVLEAFLTITYIDAANGTATRTVIGILALQGAFVEHQAALEKLPSSIRPEVILVKTPEELQRCDALIIPGGESTTIALVARLSGVLHPLKEFIKVKPVWGTCAGAILLSEAVENAKKGGQELLGGMSITIARNGWGSQVESFEAPLEVDGLRNAEQPFTGVFIRAPVVLKLNPTPTSPPIKVVSKLSPDLLPPSLSSPDHSGEPKIFVALRQELTEDNRFHEYFVKECVLSSKNQQR